MNRNKRVELAKQTLAIIDRGSYRSANGVEVSIKRQLEACVQNTKYVTPEDFIDIEGTFASVDSHHGSMEIEVVNETTLQGAARLVEEGHSNVGVLNFASAKNPGGGFLGGSQAQEESLARSSGLYASLQQCPDYYQFHRGMKSCLYTDRMILSPQCPVIMDDDGNLLDQPYCVEFITSPAPNAGAVRKNTPQDESKIEECFDQRIRRMLTLAATEDIDALVLGAWGCGVFRNDPHMVAELFANYLTEGKPFYRRFKKVLFSVLDHSERQAIYQSFTAALR